MDLETYALNSKHSTDNHSFIMGVLERVRKKEMERRRVRERERDRGRIPRYFSCKQRDSIVVVKGRT